ncbi:MAG: ribonuclease HI [Odoribacteraceae bacterium]|jgi:ribonuclease HI|nr:ribonuclease HI [Odoribacteraceae bacterium]
MEGTVIIYTDGSSRGNPGPGGYGVVMLYNAHRKELSAGYRLTTNNRMELLAVIIALEALKQKHFHVKIYTDSRYIVDAVEKRWVFKWEGAGFHNKKNPDLWRRFLRLYREYNVHFEWVPGHANVEWNERCDKLATTASWTTTPLVDDYYEEQEMENNAPGKII